MIDITKYQVIYTSQTVQLFGQLQEFGCQNQPVCTIELSLPNQRLNYGAMIAGITDIVSLLIQTSLPFSFTISILQTCDLLPI